MTSKGSGSGPPDGGSATPNPTSPSSTTTSPTTGAGAPSNNSEKSSPNATSPTSKSGRKGKAVQWLDHHLNSQAAQERGLALQEQPQPQIIEDQLPSQAAAQLKHLRELEGLRLSEQEGQLNSAGRAQELGMELEGIKARERELERIVNEEGNVPASPHALDEKALDPSPFIELTTALERHQSQTSQATLPRDPLSDSPSFSLPTVPPSAFPQSDSATVEKSRNPYTIAAPPSAAPAAAPGPRVHYFPPRTQPRSGTTVKLPPIRTQPESHALTEFSSSPPRDTGSSSTNNSPTSRLLPLSTSVSGGGTGTYTPATPGTASTTVDSSPDTAMRTAMLPIIPGEDLPEPLFAGNNSGTGNGGAKALWANLRQRTVMKRTHDVPGAFIYQGENAGLPSRGRRKGGADVDDDGDEEAQDGGDGRGIWARIGGGGGDDDDVEVHAKDVEAYAKSRAKNIVRAHTRSRRTDKKSRYRRDDTDDTDGETDYEDGKKNKKKSSLFSVWQAHKATKSKDYGNAEIDRPGGGGGYETGDSDADSLSMHSSFMAPPSGGVLGALLALYNAQNDGSLDSVPPSGASTPAIQPEPISRSKTRRERAMRQAERDSRVEASDATKVDLPRSESSPALIEVIGADGQPNGGGDSNNRSPPSTNSPAGDFHANAMSKQGITSTARKLLRLGTHRPVQSRNAGGVFGSLIASTGNISGAAAPTPSTLAPNVDRPGFNLTRYGYAEEKNGRDYEEEALTAIRGHHHGAKSLSSVQLESIGTAGNKGDGSDLERISTAPVGPGSGMPDGSRPLSILVSGTNARSEPASPSNGSTSALSDQHPHVMAHTPVSAYIPAPEDYFSNHGSQEPTPGPTPAGKGHSHSKTLSGGGTTPGGTPFSSIAKRAKWTGVLKDIPGAMHLPAYVGGKSGKSTPATTPGSTATASEQGDWWSEKESREEREKREKRERDKKDRKKRKKAELFITRHVAQIIQRQEFICKLARSMMMFGGPAHRLTAQIQATARVLDIELSCMYLPDVMLISFEDSSTGTSLIKFIKQGSVLNMGKLAEGYMIYWKVIHDDLSVSDASAALDKLMRRPPRYKWWHLMLIGGFCSAAICTVSFAGSFIDSLAVFPLGAILVGVQQLSVRNELYSNVFEITIATLFSFICGGLAASKHICYSAATSSSIVLILPGFIVLSGGLEILSRNIVAGSVRLCYAVVYCLFLGFGLAMGAEAYNEITGSPISNLDDTTCARTHDPNGPWWQRTPSEFWAFLTVPLYSLVLSMRNHQPLFSREMLICVIISCIGWVVTHFVSLKFTGQSDFASAVGAFGIGMISNLAGRFLNGNAFTIMITGILFQVPSGLGNNGLLVFVSQQTNSTSSDSDAYLSGFDTSLQLISVAIGLTIGLGIALFLSHPIPSRRRAGGVFSL